MQSSGDLPGTAESCWSQGVPRTSFRKLADNPKVDVVVIGAGIVGLTAALKLGRSGASVAVLEARRVGRQVTGRSTAKITTQHATIYRHLIDTYGLGRARLYADANLQGAQQIRDWIDAFAIDCDLEAKSAYAYASEATRRGTIEAEAKAATRLGLNAETLDKAPLPFETGPTLHFPDQAQFNPTKYLIGLASAARGAGVRIFEDTRVSGMQRLKQWRVKTDTHHVDADHVVMATHLPIDKPGRFDLWTQPRCHIAMAFRIAPSAAIDGMFIGIDEPTHSLRMAKDDDGPLLIVLGPKFPTGNDGDVAERFRDLERWTRSNLDVGEIRWRWVNEDYDTLDRVPFVGAPAKSAPRYYIATGFNGWGISNGAAAGLLIADLVQGGENPWSELYDPTRDAAKKINIGGDTQSRVKSVDEIPPGEGRVVMRGKNGVAVWRSKAGKLVARSAACTHLGCLVTWNNAEKNWDCPCHGSMFTADGDVIHGPATEKLKPAKVPTARRKKTARRRA